MIEFKVLTGKKAGTTTVARRFPFRIGRGANADLRLEDPGIFDEHLEIDLEARHRFHARVLPEALAAVNAQAVRVAELRNGDVLVLGSVQVHFGLSPPRQRSLRAREMLTWAALGALGLVQVGLIYWLLD